MTTPATRHKDFIGRQIYEGDIIAYAASRGQSNVLGLGLVINLSYSKAQDTHWNESLGDWADGPRATIQIRAISRWRHEKQKVMPKLITLQYPDRCVVVNRHEVDPKIVEALETAK